MELQIKGKNVHSREPQTIQFEPGTHSTLGLSGMHLLALSLQNVYIHILQLYQKCDCDISFQHCFLVVFLLNLHVSIHPILLFSINFVRHIILKMYVEFAACKSLSLLIYY